MADDIPDLPEEQAKAPNASDPVLLNKALCKLLGRLRRVRVRHQERVHDAAPTFRALDDGVVFFAVIGQGGQPALARHAQPGTVDFSMEIVSTEHVRIWGIPPGRICRRTEEIFLFLDG